MVGTIKWDYFTDLELMQSRGSSICMTREHFLSLLSLLALPLSSLLYPIPDPQKSIFIDLSKELMKFIYVYSLWAISLIWFLASFRNPITASSRVFRESISNFFCLKSLGSLSSFFDHSLISDHVSCAFFKENWSGYEPKTPILVSI